MPRIPPLLSPPIGFAHRGAKAHAPENTLEAFALALRLGATGLETDAWLTADGQAILDHDGVVRRFGFRKHPIDAFRRDDLPGHMPTLSELYRTCGVEFELSIDLKTTAVAEAVVDSAAAVEHDRGEPVLQRLWLVSPDFDALRGWRARWPSVRLVHSTRLGRLADTAERHAADLAEAGIDAMNMHYTDWTGGLTTLFHRFGLLAFGWDAQHRRVLDELLHQGVDGIFSDHVDRMVEAITAAYGRTA